MSASLASNAFVHTGPQFNDVAILQKYQTQEEKANFLAQETGMELILAEEFLSSNNWNLSEAIKGYKELIELEKKKKYDSCNNSEKNLKKIGRGFSLSNFQLVQQARENLVIEEREVDEDTLDKLAISARRSFVLPDITQFGKVLAAFIREDLISASTMHSLTGKGRLNWWSDIGACRKLFPLSTIGDGNCLLHAASLGMWGFHDRMLKLRKALHLVLLSRNAKKSIKRRWKYNLWKENMKSGNLMYSRDEWEEEWEEIVKLASGRPHRYDNGQRPRRISRTILGFNSPDGDGLREGESLDSLEAIHVYVLANLIRRPIIVISEDMLKDSEGRDVAPIPFGGIYLPLEKKPEVCWKYPLVLAYHMSHFTALVPAEGESVHKGERLSTSIPLMDRKLCMLPIRFAIDPGSTWDLVQDDSVKEERPELTYEEKLNLLRKYLDVVKVTFNNGVSPCEVKSKGDKKNNLNKVITQVHEIFIGLPPNILIAARLNMKERPNNYTEMIENYVSNARLRLQKLRIDRTKCSNSNCTMFSSPEFGGYCLLCHERRLYSPKPRPRGHTQNQLNANITASNHLQPRSPDPVRANRVEMQHKSRSSSPRNTTDTVDGSPIYENAIYPGDRKYSNSSNSSAGNDVSEPFGIAPDDTTVHCYQNIGVSCQSPGCKFYGSLETKGYCSSCYRKRYQNSI